MRSQKTLSKFSTHLLVLFFGIIAGGLICLPLLGAELPNAKELVSKVELLLRGEESSVQFISLASIRPGKKTSWEMIICRKGTDSCFCHVLKPMKCKNTTLLKRKPVQAILSVSQAVAKVSGGETGGSSPLGANVKLTFFKWIIGAVVVVGLIRIVWRILKR